VSVVESKHRNSPELIGYLIRLEYTYCDEGKFESAEPIARKVVWIAERCKGYSPIQLAAHFVDLGNVCCRLSKAEEAKACYNRALASFKRYEPHNADAVIRISCLLADIYSAQGKFREAQSLYETAAALKEKKSQKDAETVQILGSLGDAYCHLKKPKEAEAVYKRALAYQEKLGRPGDSRLLYPILRLGNFYLANGKASVAQPLYKRALAVKLASSSPRDQTTAIILSRLADTKANLGSDQEAEDLYEQAQAIWQELPSRNESEQSSCLLSLANLYARQHKLSLAEANYKCSLALIKDVPKYHEQYVNGIGCYIGLLRATKRNREADTLLNEVHASKPGGHPGSKQ